MLTLQQPRHTPGLFYDPLTTEVKVFQIALNNSEQLLNFKHIVSSSLFEMYLYQLTKEL